MLGQHLDTLVLGGTVVQVVANLRKERLERLPLYGPFDLHCRADAQYVYPRNLSDALGPILPTGPRAAPLT